MNNQEKIRIQQQIDLYIKGELSQDEIDELWKEFLKHPEWYDWFETEVHLRSLIKKRKKPSFVNDDKPSNTAETKSAINSKVWLYAAAAAIILAIGLQFFTFQEQTPISTFALREIEPSNLIGADVVRSNDSPAENLDVAINNALATALDGSTTEAIEEFEELLNHSPDNQQLFRIDMNLGILFYNSGNYESAQSRFQSITENEEIEEYQEEKSWWFLGNTLLHLNQPAEAREALYNAYMMNGRYQSRALSLINELDARLGNVRPEENPQ